MKLTKSPTFFMDVRGYHREYMVFGRKAVEMARQKEKTEDLAWLLVYGLGWREIYGSYSERGVALIREGLKIYENLKAKQTNYQIMLRLWKPILKNIRR